METAELVARALGCSPTESMEDSDRVREFVEERHLVEAGESFLNGVDQTWLGNARRGVFLTTLRLVRYQNDQVDLIANVRDIERIRVRRMWYPSAPLVGRGELSDAGPVVVLRFRIDLTGAESRGRLRLQDHAGALKPFLESLAELVPQIEVCRVLPGF